MVQFIFFVRGGGGVVKFFEGFRTGRKQHSVWIEQMGGKDKIKTKLVICGYVVRHAVSFREEEMACSEQESVTALKWSHIL